MRALAEYIISVSAAAFLCGIVNSLMPKGPAKEILKLVGGLFLVFTVIRPVADLQIPELQNVGKLWQEEAAEAVAQGEELALESARESITEQLEAYILDKAQELRLEVDVKVTLQEETLFPDKVRLQGSVSPQGKQKLVRYICQELGITEEDIEWTG